MTASHRQPVVRPYLLQKSGVQRSECEDAVACHRRCGAFAVADGATEAFDSRYWARLLVRAWTRNPAAGSREAFLQLVQRLGERAHHRWQNRKLAWYAEEKAKTGAYAAFVGLTLKAARHGMLWRAIAIGDCCLFQIRSHRMIRSLPLSKPEEFGFRPLLLPSKVSAQPAIAEQLSEHEGEAKSGDIFLLLSDAVASWFLGEYKTGASTIRVFQKLLANGQTAELDALIDQQRSSGHMKNDDVAAIYIRIH